MFIFNTFNQNLFLKDFEKQFWIISNKKENASFCKLLLYFDWLPRTSCINKNSYRIAKRKIWINKKKYSPNLPTKDLNFSESSVFDNLFSYVV